LGSLFTSNGPGITHKERINVFSEDLYSISSNKVTSKEIGTKMEEDYSCFDTSSEPKTLQSMVVKRLSFM